MINDVRGEDPGSRLQGAALLARYWHLEILLVILLVVLVVILAVVEIVVFTVAAL